jgi:hypothetical protein
MKLLVVSFLVIAVCALGVTGCDSGGTSGGACEYSSALTTWCSNFDDETSCSGDSWTDGTDCDALGYSQSCGSNAYVHSGGMCP